MRQEYYIKETVIREKEENEKDEELMESVIKTKLELENATKNFEYAEGDLIDYYSYQIKANQAKLDYLLKKVKKRGLVLDMINEISLRLDREDEVG
ncbi:MAG: YaaL family protein [Clostridia bacterium]